MSAVAIQHRQSIIESIASGQRLSDIAPTLGVSPNAISKVLKDDPEYVDAIEQGHACKLDRAESEIEQASEQVDVARARAIWGAVSWRAEREAAHRWGTKPMTVNIGVQVSLTAVALGSIEDLLGAVVSTQQTVESAATSPDLPIISQSSGASD